MIQKLNSIRDAVRSCRITANAGCSRLIDYREGIMAEGARHPLLFQVVPKPRIMIVGAVPGGIDSDPKKLAYQRLINAQFSLGHKSAQGLGEILLRAAKLKKIELSPLLAQNPLTPEIQAVHLEARAKLGVHVTNLVKCHAPTGWAGSQQSLWFLAAAECLQRHLKNEFEVINPECIVLLGKQVAELFSEKEGWGRKKWSIGQWTDEAMELTCFGRSRFVSAWAHPGGRYFYIQGKEMWPRYADQLAPFFD